MKCNLEYCPKRKTCTIDEAEGCRIYQASCEIVRSQEIEAKADQTRTEDMYERGLGTW